MQQNQNTGDKASKIEQSQAITQDEVREGQENSSILHDENDEELPRPAGEDISSTNQEEFIEDRNTKKKSADE